MKSGQRSNRFNRVGGIIARLGLIVSLWQAPIPLFHCHGSSLGEIASPQSACELRHHLQAFHATSELNSDEEFGWHCHWIVPSWIDVPEDSSDTGKSGDSGAFDSVIPTDTTTFEAPFFLSAGIAVLQRQHLPSLQPVPPLQLDGATIARQCLNSVMRC
jgi:hypothetical protein